MRRTFHLLFVTAILAAPLPAAAQVTVDPNALSTLGATRLPEPPSAAGATPMRHHRHRHRMRHLARREHEHPGKPAAALASATPAKPDTLALEHPKNLGPSFTSLPPLPQAAPPLPQQLALPAAAPPPATKPTRLAETTPAPPAATSAAPPPAPSIPQPPPAAGPPALPKGADRLTLPFFPQESDLPPAENAMLRNFALRYGPDAQYIVRAFASAPPGDDDPSTPRRISLARAQSVAAALQGSGAQPDKVRLLALGNTGGDPADRVDIVAMPPPGGHTASSSTP